MPSPTSSSVSSIVRPQDSVFTGQSPALTYRSLRDLQPILITSPTVFESQMVDNAQPRYRGDEEERLQDQILRAERSFGSSRMENPGTLYALGEVLMEQGRYKAAEDVIRRLVESHESQGGNGDDDADRLNALSLLGLVMSFQGLHVNAKRLFQRTLKGKEKVLGREHPDTLTSLDYLGSVLQGQGKYDEAEAMHRRALEGREKVLGREHPDTLTSVGNLGLVLERQGKYDEAGVMHRRALEGREKVLGREHPDTLTGVYHIAFLLQRQQDYSAARELYQRAYDGYVNILGPLHPTTLACFNHYKSALNYEEV
jgi:tetratricopeptide (TPR) repeat protein